MQRLLPTFFLRATIYRTILFVLLLAAGCDEDEGEKDVPAEPLIESNALAFTKLPSSGAGMFKLDLKVRDGDFNLGIANIDSPHHPFIVMLENNGGLEGIIPTYEEVNEVGLVYRVETAQTGKIATLAHMRKTQSEPPAYSCDVYLYTRIVADFDLVDETTCNILDTVLVDGDQMSLIADTLHVIVNENYYNIFVDFLVKQQDGSYEVFDWEQQDCTTFDGRFFPLDDLAIGSISANEPFEIKRISKSRMILSYSMRSLGFIALLSGRTVKLRAYIVDRALNNSNTIETEPVVIE